jgi:long-chain acyl-CoA synthetase
MAMVGKSTLYCVASTWVFDVDGTLIDSLIGNSLRPGARELLERLHTLGCTIALWSAGGAEYAEQRALEHGIAELVDWCGDKEGRDEHGRYRTDFLLDTLDGVVFVDDRPEDMPLHADVVAVSPYLAHHPHDRGLRHAATRVGL